MATKEQYEMGARNLAMRVRSTPDFENKERLMTYMGNLRYNQYKVTREGRARNLAGNCYIAARIFHLRAN